MTLSTQEDQPAVGRELDAEVAERVLGFRRHPVPKDYDGVNAGETLVPPGFREDSFTWPPRGAVSFTYFANKYSTNLVDAFTVVDAMRAKGWSFSLNQDADDSMWTCSFMSEWGDGNGEDGGAGYGKYAHCFRITSGPLAICLASLKALAVHLPGKAAVSSLSRDHQDGAR